MRPFKNLNLGGQILGFYSASTRTGHELFLCRSEAIGSVTIFLLHNLMKNFYFFFPQKSLNQIWMLIEARKICGLMKRYTIRVTK